MATRSQTPRAFPFLVKVTQISYRHDPTAPRLTNDGYWQPPKRKDNFGVHYSTGWWVWDPYHQGEAPYARLRTPSDAELSSREVHRTGTMFWAPDRQAYSYRPENCLEMDLNRSDSPYRRLGFNIYGNSNLVLVAYHGKDFQLPYRAPPRMLNTLFPPVYASRSTANRECTIAGDLAIIIGLIVLSTANTKENMLKAIDTTFRRHLNSTQYAVNQDLRPVRGVLERGIIVEICSFDGGVSGRVLKDWENGIYGEMLS
ncbi:hypothetical protein PV10_03944 [Exophiala mesophila]|uniref:Uncharacterized protein n=1 Tax=Exophiala mesophila TaxID=212818 RepID=A0A0D1XWS1_EXOME|nr:uncharacterized protein PV10_03944 [Exophiala mesophila]KIV92671.1 hypothetical protein PV10_03944 [Exophiala mesophila]